MAGQLPIGHQLVVPATVKGSGYNWRGDKVLTAQCDLRLGCE